MSVLTGLTLGEPCRWICFADGVLRELGARKRSALELTDLESWLLVELQSLFLVELEAWLLVERRQLVGRMFHRLESQVR